MNGSESEPVSWNENSTTTASGTYRKSSAAIVIASDAARADGHEKRTRSSLASRRPSRIAK